jgi:hypothetical protein
MAVFGRDCRFFLDARRPQAQRCLHPHARLRRQPAAARSRSGGRLISATPTISAAIVVHGAGGSGSSCWTRPPSSWAVCSSRCW